MKKLALLISICFVFALCLTACKDKTISNESNTPESNSDVGLTLADGWKIISKPDTAFFAYAPDGKDNINIITETLSVPMTAEDYCFSVMDELATQIDDYREHCGGDCTIGAYDGYYFQYFGSLNGVEFGQIQYCIVVNNTIYTVTYTCFHEDGYKHFENVENMLTTFYIA